jgi:hypothetical protein
MAERKRLNEALGWIFDMMSLYAKDEIIIPQDFYTQVYEVKTVLESDTSGIVNTVLDFAINSATVDYTIETDNEKFTDLISKWFEGINISLLGRIPTGIKALSKEYFRERWKNSSLLLLRTQWEDVDLKEGTFFLPTKMWFVDGQNVIIEDENPESRIIGTEDYYLRINKKNKVSVPSNKNEFIFVQKPFDSWSSIYPIPFIIQRGLYKNLKLYDMLSKKGEKFIAKALDYLLMLKKGTERLALEGGADHTYSESDLKKVKDDFKTMMSNSKSEPGTPTYVTNFDTMLEHVTPDYSKVMNENVYAPLEKRLLAGLGLVEIVEGVASTRREGILNPKPFIAEVENGIEDFTSLLRDIATLIKQRNIEKHPKYFGEKMQLHYTPIKSFISDTLRDHLRSCYDRGIISKQTYAEVVGQVDFDIEATRRSSEKTKKQDDLFYPPVITNNEQYANDTSKQPIKPVPVTVVKKDNVPVDKKGPEAKNYKGTEETIEDKIIEEINGTSEEPSEISKVVKRKDGYHVISEKTGKNLGGPYKTKKQALTRLKQVEYFKHQGKTEDEIGTIEFIEETDLERSNELIEQSLNVERLEVAKKQKKLLNKLLKEDSDETI